MANISRKSDDDLVDFLIKEEGFLSKPTNIGDGKITLGSGLTDPKWHELYRKRGNKWSKEDNRKAVASEIASRRRWAESNIPNWDDLPDSSQKALLAYKYNYDFNAANSPKLYEALRNNNLLEAAKQMDATSKDPKFKKGLEQRRARERSWFLQDVNAKEYLPEPLMLEYNAYPVSSYYDNPYARRLLYTQPQPVMIPEEQIPQVRYSEPEERIKMDALNALESLGQLYDFKKENAWENQPEPERFTPKGRINFTTYDEGGQMNTPKTWNDLSMAEKAEMMKVAILNGITDLATIRQKYNEFAEGGDISDNEYLAIMEKVVENNNPLWNQQRIEEGRRPLSVDEDLIRTLNDNTYDYRGYYNKYPTSTANADTHWPDEFKTVYHPTFSNESRYHGIKSQYNPLGLPGGWWSGEDFMPMAWQLLEHKYKKGGSIHIDPSKKGTFTAAASKHGKSVQAFASQVLAHPENYSPAMRKKANFARNAAKWHGLGGNLFDNGGEFWDTVDTYANNAEKALSIGSLAATGATLAALNPYTLGAAYVTNLGSALVDGYQGIRAALKGDYGNAAKNAAELVLSISGAKLLSDAKKLASLDDALRATNATREYVTKTVGRRAATRHSYKVTKEAAKAADKNAAGFALSAGANASSMGDLPTKALGGPIVDGWNI